MKFKPHHTAISVRNLELSVGFYEKLGFEQVHRYDEDDGSMSIVHLKLEGLFLELFAYKKNRDAPALELAHANNLQEIGVKHIALQTDDVDKALEWAKRSGLADDATKVTQGRTKVQYFFVKDPDGVWVEFLKDDRY